MNIKKKIFFYRKKIINNGKTLCLSLSRTLIKNILHDREKEYECTVHCCRLVSVWRTKRSQDKIFSARFMRHARSLIMLLRRLLVAKYNN